MSVTSSRGDGVAVAISMRQSRDCFALRARNDSMVMTDEPMSRDIENLAAYEAKLSQGLSLKASLYFYTWPQPSISVGKLQIANPLRKAKLLELSERLGLPLVTRPTGGRLVLHGGDICYTFIASLNDKGFGGDLRTSFCKVNRFVFNSLREVDSFKSFFEQDLVMTAGVDPTVIVSEAKQSILNMNKLKCFASTVSGEGIIASVAKPSIVHSPTAAQERDQRHIPAIDRHAPSGLAMTKFIGAAQAMGKRAYIQQGSIQLNRIGVPELEPQLLLADLKGEDFDLARITDELNRLVSNIDGSEI